MIGLRISSWYKIPDILFTFLMAMLFYLTEDLMLLIHLHCLELLTLDIPTFTRGKNQLSAEKMEVTRKIANVRIHVESIIGSACTANVSNFFSYRSAIKRLVSHKTQKSNIILDSVVQVCCSLNNVNVVDKGAVVAFV